MFVLLLLWEHAQHHAPYCVLFQLCLAKGLCALICLQAVVLALGWAEAPIGVLLGTLDCQLFTILATLFYFQAAFLLLCLSVTCYLAMAHHGFSAECLAS